VNGLSGNARARSIAESVSPRRGRPRKFSAPSRAVTLTLPESVIEALGLVDRDLSRAVVRLAQSRMIKRKHPPAELTVFGGRAVIVVNPSRTLEERTGVVLVPLSDGRALISFDRSLTVAQLELRIQDAIDDRRLPQADAEVFESIRRILQDARRAQNVAVEQRHIIVVETRKGVRRPNRPVASKPATRKHKRRIHP
jgi:hypothetical protein